MPYLTILSLLSTLLLCTHTPRGAVGAAPAYRSPGLDVAPVLPSQTPISVMPVFFVPSDAEITDVAQRGALVREHLALAQDHYQRLVGTTFSVIDGPVPVYRSFNSSEHFESVVADTDSDRAHRMLAELFDWTDTDRYSADVVFLAIYVSRGPAIGGGGRPFNGAPGTGGGYIEMDIASLLNDGPYPFQSTLVHELGHAFGLAHSECYGYDQASAPSIMSYNPAHHSSGTRLSQSPGALMPEERALLSLAHRILPGIRSEASDVDPAVLQRCFLGPMSETIGPMRSVAGAGYELSFDGRMVHGPDATLYSRSRAEENCAWNRARYPHIDVECSYNGRPVR